MFESFLLAQSSKLHINFSVFGIFTGFTDNNNYLSVIPFIVKGINITPVKSYLNADIDKKLVYDENKKKSGVYIWINLSNNNCYVGSSSNLSKRFSWYYDFNNLNKLLENSTSLNPLLKYRHENFILKIHPAIPRRRVNYFSSKTTSVIPAKMYANADTQKAQIIKENKNCGGVYRWTHLPSGNCYIGSSINLSGRFSQYYNIDYLANKHGKSRIRSSLLYNGYSLFSLEILEYCAPEKVIEREQYYLDLLEPEYNILKTAGSLLGYKHPEGGGKLKIERQNEKLIEEND